jgi:hypothetical protein
MLIASTLLASACKLDPKKKARAKQDVQPLWRWRNREFETMRRDTVKQTHLPTAMRLPLTLYQSSDNG